MKKFIRAISLLVASIGLAVAINTNQTADAAVVETPMHGILTVRYNGRGGVNLLDNNGKYQMQYVKKNSRWKVFAKATINGRLMFKIGNERQWIPAQYATVATGSAPTKRTVATTRRGGSNQLIVGNRRTKKFHMPGQEYYHIKPANRVYFNSVAQAKAAGYTLSRR